MSIMLFLAGVAWLLVSVVGFILSFWNKGIKETLPDFLWPLTFFAAAVTARYLGL